MAKVEDEYDFGFTFADEDEIIQGTESFSNLEEEIKDLKNRLHDLNKIFKPLLENLAKNPDKPMIKWPNRKEIIDKQLKRLEALTKV